MSMLGLKPERLHLLLETVSQSVALCGKQLIADNSGALYWPGEATLLVADLHLEKGSAYAERGQLAAALRHARDLDAPGRGHRPV